MKDTFVGSAETHGTSSMSSQGTSSWMPTTSSQKGPADADERNVKDRDTVNGDESKLRRVWTSSKRYHIEGPPSTAGLAGGV